MECPARRKQCCGSGRIFFPDLYLDPDLYPDPDLTFQLVSDPEHFVEKFVEKLSNFNSFSE